MNLSSRVIVRGKSALFANLVNECAKMFYFKFSCFLQKRTIYVLAGILTMSVISGCDLNHPDPNALGLPNWRVDVLPQTMCVSDRIRVRYRIGNECPDGFSCDGLYTTVQISSSNPTLFSMMDYPQMTFNGEISSNPINSSDPFTINVSSRWSFISYRSDGSDGQPRGAFRWVRPLPVNLDVQPIVAGGQLIRPITFDGQCAGHSPAWTPVSLSVNEGVRSESVRLRRLCNRDLRVVTFTALYASGLPAQEIALTPNGCIDIATDAPPTMITALTARPNTELPGEVMPRCLDSMASSPPAPIRAELTMGCQ